MLFHHIAVCAMWFQAWISNDIDWRNCNNIKWQGTLLCLVDYFYNPGFVVVNKKDCRFKLCGKLFLLLSAHHWKSLFTSQSMGALTSCPWWRHQMETFSALLAICARNSPVNPPHKGQWRGTLMFSLVCVWINNGEAGDLRCHRSHYDVIVMIESHCLLPNEWGLISYRYSASLVKFMRSKWSKRRSYHDTACQFFLMAWYFQWLMVCHIFIKHVNNNKSHSVN